MAKEQEEAIEIVEGIVKSYIEADECGLSNNDFKHEIRALQTVLNILKEKDKEIEKALEIAFQYGQIDGDHHKTWVIDQMVRILTGDKYNEFVKEYETDEETGEKEWTWKNGIAP